ncbi:unnamed protein product (macronuclear) [Paramecium tetraurelia]|uniref:Uncharacterized protein n=1 Tax=Paramecium tetraurelia TaxID=5888 RepID=A0ECZ0_PARTE|nr:uncharacterized protein GSPATT00004026001 [Paramecium tetraurelia]CAK93157.1 unnamed protein product [Paramecium tetraurelia]|eukprot:XP_001460554.1 hypothetical protein (macronuclear) [Paramecium tetraurelia strain d4-2]
MEFKKEQTKATSKRFKKITQKLGIQSLNKEERFDEGMKDFQNLDTFFTVTDLLKDMNKEQPTPERQALFESQQTLIKTKLKLKKWKSEYPAYFQFEQKPPQTQYRNKVALLQKAQTHLNLEKYEPKLCKEVENLSSILKDKFKNVDMKEYPQLQLFQEISQYEDLRVRTEFNESLRDSYCKDRLSLKLEQFEQKPTVSYETYYKNYHNQAEQLRNRLRQQQMNFFNQKWGNSVVKMKMKEAQDKRGFLEKAKQIRRPAVTKKVVLPYLAPVIKNIITDICVEEADMMEQKRDFKKDIQELAKIGSEFYDSKPEPQIMGLRIVNT